MLYLRSLNIGQTTNSTESIDSIIQYVPNTISSDPSLLIYIGLSITLVFGIFFARTMQLKINNWERDNLSPLPFESIYTITGWVGAFFGLTILFTGALEIFAFSPIKSLVSAFLASLIPGITMWNVVKDLMKQMDSGKIKEIDEYF